MYARRPKNCSSKARKCSSSSSTVCPQLPKPARPPSKVPETVRRILSSAANIFLFAAPYSFIIRKDIHNEFYKKYRHVVIEYLAHPYGTVGICLDGRTGPRHGDPRHRCLYFPPYPPLVPCKMKHNS